MYNGGLAELDFGGGLNMDEFRSAYEAHQELLKATTALVSGAYVSDPASLIGGAALRMQSIEPALQVTIPKEDDFVLFRQLAMTDALASIDEYTIYDDVGAFLGSGFLAELDDIEEAQGNYQRVVAKVKLQATMRQVSVFKESEKSFVDVLATEAQGAITELKSSAEWCLFFGDETVIPEEPNGLLAQILTTNETDMIVDAAGAGLDAGGSEVLTIAQNARQLGRLGKITDLYCSPNVQSAEFDFKLQPGVRVNLDAGRGAYDLGTPVQGVKSSFGRVANNPDIFIQEGQPPWEGRTGKYPGFVTAKNIGAPVIASAVAATGTAANKFLTAHAGNYYWGVESESRRGRSVTVVSAQVAVAAGQKVTVTITNPADALVKGFVISRSRKNGTNAKSDLREMIRIPRQGGASTVFVDENLRIPGTSPVILLSRGSDTGVGIRRMGALRRFPLFPTTKLVRPWAHFWFWYLRNTKPRQQGVILNVTPGNAAWKPFN